MKKKDVALGLAVTQPVEAYTVMGWKGELSTDELRFENALAAYRCLLAEAKRVRTGELDRLVLYAIEKHDGEELRAHLCSVSRTKAKGESLGMRGVTRWAYLPPLTL